MVDLVARSVTDDEWTNTTARLELRLVRLILGLGLGFASPSSFGIIDR